MLVKSNPVHWNNRK